MKDTSMVDVEVGEKTPETLEKWKLVPEFLKVRGLVKQHIESFDYFINQELKNIIMAQSNNVVRSEQDSTFYMKYLDIRVSMPNVIEEAIVRTCTPHMCRLRNMTYSADILVDLEYIRGDRIIIANDVKIGKMPIMLGSSNCHLRGKSLSELARMQECPYDPRGYFIIKGVEKVILIMEQMSKNRIIVELDSKKNYCASVISSTHDTKSRTTISQIHGKFSMKHNSFEKDVPICVIFKAMGIESEQEIAQMVGSDQKYLEAISLSLKECLEMEIYTQKQALLYVASRMKSLKNLPARPSLIADTRAMLKKVILAHIPTKGDNLAPKCRYLALMIRRIIDAIHDDKIILQLEKLLLFIRKQ